MVVAANAPQDVGGREALQQKILSFLQSEIQDKAVMLSMQTPLDSVAIDSVDILHVLFKVEEEFKIEIQFSPDNRFSTVGDIVHALTDLIPPPQ
jgi:acyl carrier protein